jgi:Tol biopolymer transport system component
MTKTTTTLLGALLTGIWTVTALAVTTFTIVRLTDSGGCSQDPSIDGRGQRVVFVSDGDFAGNNADGNDEIFLVDRRNGTTTQITDTAGGGNFEPAISAIGGSVVFASPHDLTGDNLDNSQEIFLFRESEGLTQLTDGATGFAGQPAISKTGTGIAFSSNLDLVPGGNTDGNQEIFALRIGRGFTQITDTTDGALNESPALNRPGTGIAFRSTADLIPGDNTDGNSEIFVFHRGRGFTQVTNSDGCFNGPPSVAKSGAMVAFASDCDLTGGNADGNSEIFLFDRRTGVTQITDSPSGESVLPGLDGRGSRMAFMSTADLVSGGNADGSAELFVFDRRNGLIQVTDGTGGESGVEGGPSLSSNGKTVAFEASAEFEMGSNPDGDGEIYVAETP